MKKKIVIYLAAAMIFTLVFSGCNAISNKVPEKYTEGIKYDRDFPDDVFEIYDDAIVFDSKNLFGEIILSFGTEDDVEDVIEFYKEFFEENEIVPAEEEEDRDEYYARGVFEGYEFRLQIMESDGEYVEDLFECVVYLAAKESDGESLKQTAAQTASPAPSKEPTATPKTTSDPTAKATATPTAESSDETPLGYLEPGAWEMAAILVGEQFVNAEATMYLGYDGSGAFYYYDYNSDERDFYYFTYEAGNGKLDLYTEEGGTSFQAYFDDGILHLSDGADTDMFFANWSENYGVDFSEYEFTAYGDWMYYEPETGYVETIAFWPDGSGYIYNWGGNGKNLFMYWAFENGMFTISDENGDEYTYGISHRGEVFELVQLNGSVFFYNRVSGSYWLTGTFYMDESNEENSDERTMTLYSDGSCEYTINGQTDQTSWGIDRASGKMLVVIGGSDYYFDYHYDLEGLYLWNPENGLQYHFLQVG